MPPEPGHKPVPRGFRPGPQPCNQIGTLEESMAYARYPQGSVKSKSKKPLTDAEKQRRRFLRRYVKRAMEKLREELRDEVAQAITTLLKQGGKSE
jgi:hypothetical protein